MATITHTQTRTTTAPPAASSSAPYRVADVVTAATGISTSVFVFKVAGSVFDRVATVLDMETYPDSLVAASNANLPYYRQTSMAVDFTDVSLAIDFAATVRTRLTALANEYEIVTTSFTAGSPQTETLP